MQARRKCRRSWSQIGIFHASAVADGADTDHESSEFGDRVNHFFDGATSGEHIFHDEDFFADHELIVAAMEGESATFLFRVHRDDTVTQVFFIAPNLKPERHPLAQQDAAFFRADHYFNLGAKGRGHFFADFLQNEWINVHSVLVDIGIQVFARSPYEVSLQHHSDIVQSAPDLVSVHTHAPFRYWVICYPGYGQCNRNARLT